MTIFDSSRPREQDTTTGANGRGPAPGCLASHAPGAEESESCSLAPGAHSLRANLAAGYDLVAGARIIQHRAQVERVRASEMRETGKDARQCYPRRVPGAPRIV